MYRRFLAYALCSFILACGAGTPGPASDSGLAPAADSGAVADSGAAADSGPAVDAGTLSDAGQQQVADASQNGVDAANPTIADSGVEPAADAGQPVAETCGGIRGTECARGWVCDLSDNAQCGTELAGVCVVDERVNCTREYAPVCGCDGQTYVNDCHRRAAHVAYDHVGGC